MFSQLDTSVLRTDLQSHCKSVLSTSLTQVDRDEQAHFIESQQNFTTPSLPALQNPKQACSPAVPNCSTQVYEHCIRNANIFLHLGKHWHRELFFPMLTAGSLNKSSVSPRVGEEKKILILKICHQQLAIAKDTVHVSLKYGSLK